MSMEKGIEFKWLSFLREDFNEMAVNGETSPCVMQTGGWAPCRQTAHKVQPWRGAMGNQYSMRA